MSGETIYQWAKGSQVKIDPQLAGERLEAIRIRHNGHLTPHAVVEDARSRKSPLNKAFEWNEAKAAQGYRIEQAKYLLRSLVVMVKQRQPTGPGRPLRAFVSVPADDEEPRSYRPTIDVLSDGRQRERILREAERDCRAWIERYRGLLAAADLSKLFQGALRVIEDKREGRARK